MFRHIGDETALPQTGLSSGVGTTSNFVLVSRHIEYETTLLSAGLSSSVGTESSKWTSAKISLPSPLSDVEASEDKFSFAFKRCRG